MRKGCAGNEAGRVGASPGTEGEGEMCPPGHQGVSVQWSHTSLIYSLFMALHTLTGNMHFTLC